MLDVRCSALKAQGLGLLGFIELLEFVELKGQRKKKRVQGVQDSRVKKQKDSRVFIRCWMFDVHLQKPK